MKSIRRILKICTVLTLLFSINSSLIIQASSYIQNPFTQMLSDLSEAECISFFIKAGASKFANNKTLFSLYQEIINAIEQDPYYEYQNEDPFLQNYGEQVQDIVRDYYKLDTKWFEAELQDSIIISAWDESYGRYNCYGFVIDQTYGRKRPGYTGYTLTETSFIFPDTVDELADLVKEDLNNLGYPCVSILKDVSQEQVIAFYEDGYSIICMRIGANDFHFMKYYEGYWYHKVSTTSIYRYKYFPDTSRVWSNETFHKGEVTRSITYTSEIVFIIYKTC